MNRIKNNKHKFFIRLVGISLTAIFLFTLAGCSCENKKIDSSSSAATPTGSSSEIVGGATGSSDTAGSSGSSYVKGNQNGSSSIGSGDSGGSSSLYQGTPVGDIAVLAGRWEHGLISPYDNLPWVFILDFAKDGTFTAFCAPKDLGGTEGFNGNLTVSNGNISFTGTITDMDGNIIDNNVGGIFLASITSEGKLILRDNDTRGFFNQVAVADTEYTKVQDTRSE